MIVSILKSPGNRNEPTGAACPPGIEDVIQQDPLRRQTAGMGREFEKHKGQFAV